MDEFAIIRTLAFGILSMIGAYIACHGAYYDKFAQTLIGSDALAVGVSVMLNQLFWTSLLATLAIFLVVFVTSSVFIWKLLKPAGIIASSVMEERQS